MVKKSKLMIPFSYYNEDMYSWCSYCYEEGRKNSDTMIWDTINNIKVWQPSAPYKTSGWEEKPNSNYEIEYKEYQIKMNSYNNKIKNGQYIEVEKIVWKENFEFKDTLKLTSMSRGRSAANFNLESTITGKDYNLFMTDIVDMIQNGVINKGEITGKWSFVKRGQNYGIKYLGDDN